MRVYEVRALRRLPAASMLPAGSRRAAPETVYTVILMRRELGLAFFV